MDPLRCAARVVHEHSKRCRRARNAMGGTMLRWLLIAVLLAGTPTRVWAKEFRFAFQSDVASLDPQGSPHFFSVISGY